MSRPRPLREIELIFQLSGAQEKIRDLEAQLAEAREAQSVFAIEIYKWRSRYHTLVNRSQTQNPHQQRLAPPVAIVQPMFDKR